MKVKELIIKLQMLESLGGGERVVIMAQDGEGNSFSPLADMEDNAAYRADSTWSGEVGLEVLDEKHRASGFTEEDLVLDGEPALVFWPTN